MSTVGIDKDNISILEAKQLKEKIMQEQQCQIVLHQTNRGFHLLLIFNRYISNKENFKIREKYGDCIERMRRSKLRGKTPGVPIDILFSMKKINGDTHWRKRMW